MSTINGHKHFIKHPGFTSSTTHMYSKSNDFWFSDNIEKWMGYGKVKYVKKKKP